MRKIRFLEPAQREFLDEVVYYNQLESGLGDAFAQEVEQAAVRALSFPHAGSKASMNTKRVFVHRFPFCIVYRDDDEGIVIFAVAHHSRRPNYWASRL
ncbi:MAG: type II toxin-antitoxin system RelE/ParE family toxin [Acidobacteria bacterium]|nr:type II toxin-antitoxin system RelE/ParE family toxin [Acidobacteriota bacterium]